MGANIAKEVADEKFCETTIGNYCKEQTRGARCGLRSPVAGRWENLRREKQGRATGPEWCGGRGAHSAPLGRLRYFQGVRCWQHQIQTESGFQC